MKTLKRVVMMGLLFCTTAVAAENFEDVPGWTDCLVVIDGRYQSSFRCNINGQQILIWTDGNYAREMT